ncbi:hypothetical protein BDP27DRAFT_1187111, partial [Rhodocollybia butyracea]
IGAFTDIVDSVADLFRIGIPVWFVHPWADHASVEIGCVVPPLDVDFTGNLLPIRDSDMKLDISDCNPPHPIIYSGLPGRYKHYIRMATFVHQQFSISLIGSFEDLDSSTSTR